MFYVVRGIESPPRARERGDAKPDIRLRARRLYAQKQGCMRDWWSRRALAELLSLVLLPLCWPRLPQGEMVWLAGRPFPIPIQLVRTPAAAASPHTWPRIGSRSPNYLR